MGRIINRRRVMGGKDVLPYGAVPIEYLESSGTQYIDTGLVHQIQNYEYFIDFTPSQNENESIVFGSSNRNMWDGQSWRNVLYIGSTSKNASGFNRVANIRQTTRLVVVNNHATIYKDGNITSDFDFGGSIISGRHILLYAYAFNSNNASGLSSQRVYSFSIIMNGVKVLDFIPVRVGYTGYMYDKVSGQLFGNSGTGSFILGPDKESHPVKYKQLEYIESTGTQYINTNIDNWNNTLEYEIKLEIRQQSGKASYYGAYNYWSSSGHIVPLIGTYTNYRVPTSFTAGYDVGSGTDIGIIDGQTGIISLKGNSLSWSAGSFTQFNRGSAFIVNVPIILFGTYASNGVAEKTSNKIYYAKFWLNGNLVRNFIPAVLQPDNIVGMYDLVNNLFYFNSGTGDFIAGPEV